jgi:hypothetical protein
MKKIYIAAILAIVTLALSIPLRAYVIAVSRSNGNIVRHKWKNSAFPITWQMNPVQGANVTGTRTQAEVFAASFASFQSISTASVSFTQGAFTSASTRPGGDDINLITTNTLASDLPPGVLALTAGSIVSDTGGDPNFFAGEIVEGDIFFNATTLFTTNATATADRVDLQAVMTHEIGHFLGLDHSPIISATMFWTVGKSQTYPRTLSTDDIAGISILYPSGLFASKGKISGTIRTTANVPVYGAIVVAVNASGTPAGSAVTDPAGAYTIEGLDAGSYTVYAEPLDGPIMLNNISSLPDVFPGLQANTTFTTRSR